MKVPVIKAFGATFAYLAQHAVDLAKALWLPVALLVGLQLYAMAPFFGAISSLIALGENPDPAEAAPLLGELGKWGLVLTAGSAVAYPMMTVASLRHVVRGDELRAPFYLRYGGDELRVLAAYILLSAMIVLISIVGGLAASVAAMVFALVSPQARALANSLGELVLNVVLTWFRLRLCVLYPASVATGTIGFGVAWSVTKGCAWSLLFFWILIGLVLLPVAALMAPFAGDLIGMIMKLSEVGADKDAAREAAIPILQELSRLFGRENPAYAAFAFVLFIVTMATTAVTNVAAGIAWRYLTDRQKPPQAGAEALAA